MPNVRLCSIVKGNAYGHGLTEFVQMAMDAGVDYFGVHAAEEAFHLKSTLKKMPDTFIMGAIEGDAIRWAIDNEVEFAVFDFARMNLVLHYAKELGKAAKVHIEMETGMQRTGFNATAIPDLVKLLQEHSDAIIFQGLFTHFAGAESQANHFRIAQQIVLFESAMKEFSDNGLSPVYHHTACSAAVLNYPNSPGNMARVGILQYGYWPNQESYIRYCGDGEDVPNLLKRVIRWGTTVMSVKEVHKGSFVGYGTSFLAHKNLRLAIIPIGYSHGYSRNLSNVGSVLIHGRSAPVVGTVNMNSLTVDITHIPEVKKGDEVILIGKQKERAITVNSFSEQSQQLNYELLTRLPYSIPRVVVR